MRMVATLRGGAGWERSGDENTRHRNFLSKSTSWMVMHIMAPSMTNINSIYEALTKYSHSAEPPAYIISFNPSNNLKK